MKKLENWKCWFLDLGFDFAASFLLGIGIWCFIEPSNTAPGGVSGVSLLINHLTGLPVGSLTLVLNIPLFISAWFLLNRKMTLKTIRSVIIMTFVLDGLISPFFPQYIGDRLISSACGGMLVGVGMTLFFMRGSTSGGGDIIAKLLQRRYPYMQTGYALMLIDIVVIGTSAIVFGGIDTALYGIISMVASTQTIDALLYGMNKGAMVMIHSAKNREIADDIMASINRGTTFFKSVGGYSHEERETLICVIDRKQFHLVKAIVNAHDPHAFVVVAETKETYGEGFMKI